MEQRDYILREIEKIHVVILAILGKIKGGDLNIPYAINHDFEKWNGQLIEETRVDLNDLLNSGNDQFDAIFRKEYGYNETNIELFADMLAEMAEKAKGAMGRQLYQKALETYEYVDNLSNIFSFQRRKKIEDLKEIVS